MMGQRLYAVAAKKSGSRKMRFLHDFGFGPSPEHLMDKVRKRLLMEPEFRALAKGWTFCVILADFLLKVGQDGTTLMYQNDKEKLR